MNSSTDQPPVGSPPAGSLAFALVIGCTGATVSEGITNVNLPEAGVKRQVVTAARRTIIIADGSKIGSVSLAPVCPIDDIDLLVTGPSAPVDELDRLEAQGLAVDVVEVAGSPPP